MQYIGIAIGIIAMAGYGFGDYLEAIVARSMGTIKAAFWNYAIGFAILAVLLLLPFRPSWKVSATSMEELVLAGILGGIAYYSFFKGFEKGDIAIVSPVSNSFSIITVTLGIFFLSERLTGIEYLGIAAIIAGAILMSIKEGSIKNISASLKYGFATMLFWGIMMFLLSMAALQAGWLIPVLFIEAIGLLMYLALGAKAHELSFPNASRLSLATESVLIILAFISVSYAASMGFALIAVPLASAAPFITVLLAIVVSKERFNPVHMLGIASILFGILFLSI